MIHVVLLLDPRRAGIGCRILMAYIGVIADYWIGLLVIVGYGADVMKVDSENGTIYFLLFIGWLLNS